MFFAVAGHAIHSSSKLPPGVTKERLLHALPTVGVFTEHQWAVMPAEEDVELVHDAFVLNNISIFSASTQLGKVSRFLKYLFYCGDVPRSPTPDDDATEEVKDARL